MDTAAQSPSGCGGMTLFPNMVFDSFPLLARIWSRIISASMRKREPRARSLFSGSLLNCSVVEGEDCWYAFDMTICLTRALMFHPDLTKETARWSRSSGWLGTSPCAPKSSAVFTSPTPKNCCQIRFTLTRAVSGLSGWMNHSARSRREAIFPFFLSGGRKLGVPRGTSKAGSSYWPRFMRNVGRIFALSFMTIAFGMEASSLLRCFLMVASCAFRVLFFWLSSVFFVGSCSCFSSLLVVSNC